MLITPETPCIIIGGYYTDAPYDTWYKCDPIIFGLEGRRYVDFNPRYAGINTAHSFMTEEHLNMHPYNHALLGELYDQDLSLSVMAFC